MKTEQFNHYKILKTMIDNVEGVDNTFLEGWDEWVKLGVISEGLNHKVQMGLNSWITDLEDVFCMLNNDLKYFMYYHLIRKIPECVKYIPKELVDDFGGGSIKTKYRMVAGSKL